MRKLCCILAALLLLAAASCAEKAPDATSEKPAFLFTETDTTDKAASAAESTGTSDTARDETSAVTDAADETAATASSASEAPSTAAETTTAKTTAAEPVTLPAGTATIRLNGSSATASSNAVRISGSTVTITDAGSYTVTGSLDGELIVNADKDDKVEIILSGAQISSPTSAALYVRQADKVTLKTAAGTVNTLSNGGSFVAIDEYNIDAALFSRDDLVLGGDGKLTVTSPAGHGVVSKDDLTVSGGEYVIDAAKHGLSANDSITIKDGVLTVVAGKDGLQAENDEDAALGWIEVSGGSLTVTADGDGLSASSTLTVTGGDFTLTCGGGSGKTLTESDGSAKGLKAVGNLTVTGGNLTIDSADDALHANADLTVEGGNFTIATGDDGLHADENTVIRGGSICITKSYEGIEGMTVEISGGDIRITASDDGINAAGGADGSGFGGGDRFGGGGKWNPTQMMPTAVAAPAGASASTYSLTISGGKVVVNAEGDGLDSNGTLTVSGGETYVYGPTRSGNGAIDYESAGSISGGTLIALDGGSMSMNFSSAEQGSILLSVGSQAAGTTVKVTDAAGKVLASCQSEKTFSTVIVSCPALTVGESYTVTVGDYTETVALDTALYGGGSSFGHGGMGGGKGGMGPVPSDKFPRG